MTHFLRHYLATRWHQFGVFVWIIGSLLMQITIQLKTFFVRRMYWGRNSLYKSSFHVIVIITTVTAVYMGFGTRLAAPQQARIENISVSSGFITDSDIVYQEGALFPLTELNEESDLLFIDYTVREGDSLNKIAEDNGLKADTIRWANNIAAGRDTLKVGQTIKLPVLDGVLYSVKSGDTVDSVLNQVQLQDQENDRLTFLELNADKIDSDGNLLAGTQVLLVDATLKQPDPPPARAPRVARGNSSQFVETDNTGLNVSAGTFVNPMQQTSYYVSRGYFRTHTGVDLVTPSGSWVVSAGSGTVLTAGWCASLGYCVVIAHPGGYQTLYGHGNGVFAVRAGQGVSPGQRIMQSGCTGNCYGAHVHLSLTVNNQDVLSCYFCRVNPAGVIPY